MSIPRSSKTTTRTISTQSHCPIPSTGCPIRCGRWPRRRTENRASSSETRGALVVARMRVTETTTLADAHAKHHDYHLVDPSPWPAVGSVSAFITAVGAISWMHHMYAAAPLVFGIGTIGVLYTFVG